MTRIKVSKKDRYAINRDLDSGKYYLSFPVFNGYVDYEEYYEVLPDELESIMRDETALQLLLQKSHNRENDERLLLKPGSIRGSPC